MLTYSRDFKKTNAARFTKWKGKTCACGEPARKRGLCSKCYMRIYRERNPSVMANTVKELEDKIAKLEIENQTLESVNEDLNQHVLELENEDKARTFAITWITDKYGRRTCDKFLTDAKLAGIYMPLPNEL